MNEKEKDFIMYVMKSYKKILIDRIKAHLKLTLQKRV